MYSLVIYPLKHVIPKKKNWNGFPFPSISFLTIVKPGFTIFVPENEVTLIWFSLFIGKMCSFFQAIERIFLWLRADGYELFVWGRTLGFQKNHRGLWMWLLWGSNPMFCFPILVPSGSGKTGLLEGTLSAPVSFIIQGGGAFAALGLIFPYHKNRSLGFF